RPGCANWLLCGTTTRDGNPLEPRPVCGSSCIIRGKPPRARQRQGLTPRLGYRMPVNYRWRVTRLRTLVPALAAIVACLAGVASLLLGHHYDIPPTRVVTEAARIVAAPLLGAAYRDDER